MINFRQRLGAYSWSVGLIRVLAVGIAATSSGCGTSDRSKLVGEWTANVELDQNVAMEGKQLTVHANFLAASFTMTYEPAADSNEMHGTWRIIESNGDQWRVQLTATSGDLIDQRRALDLTFEGNDSFTAKEVGGDDRIPPLTFRRD